MANQPSLRPSIILFGDSLTEQGFGVNGRTGWASLLSADYSRRADVLNRGYFGYNSKHAVGLLPSLKGVLEGDLLFCTVYFGANDATVPGSRQFIPEDQFAVNLSRIITTIRQANRQVPIIIMTPPPLHEAAWTNFKGIANRTNEQHFQYGNVIKNVAEKSNCAVLDVWDLLQGQTSPDVYGNYLTDGLHLNEEGNRKLHRGLVDLIRKDYPDLSPRQSGSTTGVPLQGKAWDELC